MIFYISNVYETFTQNKPIGLNNFFIDLLNEINKTRYQNYSFYYLSSILLHNFFCYNYQNKYSGTEKILLYKVGFIIIITIIIIIELTHTKTILENIVEIEPQPVALDFKNISQYSSRSK